MCGRILAYACQHIHKKKAYLKKENREVKKKRLIKKKENRVVRIIKSKKRPGVNGPFLGGHSGPINTKALLSFLAAFRVCSDFFSKRTESTDFFFIFFSAKP
jgi:hypothetical protein